MMTEREILTSYHQILLGALREREKEIFRYLVILGPALGGFIWLLYKFEDTKCDVIITATIGIWFLCILGAWYSAALGYNYRYITLELGKLEKKLRIQNTILASWVKTPEYFLNHYTTFCKIPWCEPPEVIKWFWLAFPTLIAFTSITAYIYTLHCVLVLGTIPFLLAILIPIYYGFKLHSLCRKELNSENKKHGVNSNTEPDGN